MIVSLLRQFCSETGIRRLVFLAALILIPVTLTFLLARTATGLVGTGPLEAAQLARQIATGHGFSTLVIRPLAGQRGLPGPTVPDLVQPPAHPALLALAFHAAGIGEKTVVHLGLGLWLVTVWLVILVARQWWDNWVALVAGAFFLGGTGLIAAAGGGLPHPLLALGLLILWWCGFPPPLNDQLRPLPSWRLVAAGVVCGVVILTDYLLWPLALLLVAFQAATQRPRGRAIAGTSAGLLLVLLPWGIRNLSLGVGPWGLFSYEALTNTDTYPGQLVWLHHGLPPHPLVHFVNQPLELVRKLCTGLWQLHTAGNLFNPVMAFLFATAIWGAPAGSWRKRLALSVVAAAGVVVVSAAVMRLETRLLLAWMPLLACVAAAQLVVWTNSRRAESPRLAFGTLCVALLLAVLPVVPLLLQPATVFPSRAAVCFQSLTKQLPATGVIATDVPTAAAWYTGRPALWLPNDEEDLVRLSQPHGGVAGTYLNSASGPAWWEWLATPRGRYQDLVFVPTLLPGLARVVPPADPPDPILDQLRARARREPAVAEHHLFLGLACLQRHRLREAQSALQAAHEIEPELPVPQLGLWEIRARLVYVDGTLKLAQLAAQTAAADSRSTAVMEQAAQHLAELATQVPNDPWLLLQRALIARRRGLDKETTESLAAIQQIAPRTLPPRLLLATAAAQNGHVEIALAEAQRATQESPTHAGAWFVLGRWLLNADQPDQALPAFQHADGLRPDWGSPRILAGEACRRLQRYDQALTLTASATNNPALARLALLSLADIHNAAGHTNEAVTLYQRFLQDDPDHHIAANNLAELLAARGDLPAALALADRLEQLFPTVVPILDTVGWIRHRAGQHAAASRLLREAIRLAPALGIAHFHLGQVLLAQGQKAEAATAFRRALECPLSPADRQAAEQALAALPQ